MDLVKLEVRNHRSIKELWGEDAIKFGGLNCLVGKNNVGKTNIISSIKYLLEEEDKALDEELYWSVDPARQVEVRGYFDVLEDDLARIEDEEKRNQIEELLLDEEEFRGCLGICRLTEPGKDVGNNYFKLIQLRPVCDRLSEEVFRSYWNDQWRRTNEEHGFTETDYRDEMMEEYPEVSEFVHDDKLTQMNSWKEAYNRYIASRPDDLELEPTPSDFPTGTKQIIREIVLPDVIKIPAIKEIEDATQASGELGELTDALYSELEEDLNDQLDEQLSGIYDHLDDSSETFETRLSDYLKETFRDYSVELDFPRVESRRLFRGVSIRIEDEKLGGTLSHENVGEGVRRVLVFSMLRTIADLRDGSLAANKEDGETNKKQPLLILYEEAELFLHPNLQKNMLRVFSTLCGNQAQIVFNTHSPVLIQNWIDTINVVRKEPWTDVTQFHTILGDRDAREQSRLLDLQKVSSYIFSDRVVLVEGASDKIVLEKITSILYTAESFEIQNIPILELGGKDDFPLFKNFLEELGIEVFAMTDIGALNRNIPRMIGNDSLRDDINALKGRAGQIGENSWKQSIINCDEELEPARAELRTKLLEENILVLMGELEDYYPDGDKSNKMEAALAFSASDYNPEEIFDHFVALPDQDQTDVEYFLERIF